MTVCIQSLGCRLNQYEIQSISTSLQSKGHRMVDGPADVTIVNTCVVTVKSEAKTRNLINRAEKQGNDDEKVIVTGCYAKTIKKDGNTIYVPNDYKHLIPDLVDNWDLIDNLQNMEPSRFHYTPPVLASTTRANLKIQDGCDNFCTYCIIPLVRGNPVSRNADEILTEFRTLIKNGYKEIVLTGITIGKYQSEEITLAKLISMLLHEKSEFRLHLSSIDPDLVDDDLIKLLTHKKMVQHLHLSLQSGSNGVLQRMNRKYNREDYLTLVKKIKAVNPLFNLTTDVITGFPGESEKEHAETLELIEAVGFSHVHTFRYSPRPLTPAAEMKNQITEVKKKERSTQVMEISRKLQKKYFKNFDGMESQVLIEKNEEKRSYGLNTYYLPVWIDEKLKENTFFKIKTQVQEKLSSLKGVILP